MTLRFHGTHQQLKGKLLPLALDGEWESLQNGVWKFKCRDRSGLNWSETKGTVWCDGPGAARDLLTQRVEVALSDGSVVEAPVNDGKILWSTAGTTRHEISWS